MPFKKVGNDDYTSPSGRHFNGKQVRLWHHLGGKFPGQTTAESHAQGGSVMKRFPIPDEPAPSGGEKPPPFAKGDGAHEASYAQGGSVLGRTRDFMKESDGKDQKLGGNKIYKNPDLADSNYTKKGKSHPGRDKSLKAITPR